MQPKHRLSKQDAVANDGVPTKSPQISPGGNLDEALAIALSLFEKGDAVSRRRGAAWTVISLLEYKRKHQVVPWSRLNPAYELVVSLGDLDLGKDDPMFAPLRGGKPKASTRRELLQETAAAAVTILMEGGMREEDANKLVADYLTSLGMQGNRRTDRQSNGGGLSKAAVGNWRNRVTRKPRDQVALYWCRLDQWHQGRHRLPGLTAERFVKRRLLPDLEAFLDPK